MDNKIEETPILIFDSSVMDKVLKSLGLRKDEESKLIDEEGKVITSQDFESITYDEFGGMLKGSKIPIKNKESELVEYFISKNIDHK